VKTIKTVLIIEDDRYNRELEKALFEQAGYTILEAGDAEKGIAIAEDEKPDLIVLDFQLPGISGLQALEDRIDKVYKKAHTDISSIGRRAHLKLNIVRKRQTPRKRGTQSHGSFGNTTPEDSRVTEANFSWPFSNKKGFLFYRVDTVQH
jgi:CheY-like chemotaxis protein